MIPIYNLFELYDVNQKPPKYLYHGSPIQNLKELDPNKGITSSDMNDKKRIHAASTKQVASAFTFQWNDSMGIRFGFWDNGPYEIFVPKKHLLLLNNPCSIYTIPGDSFKKTLRGLPEEFYSKGVVKVLKEEKFNTVYDVLKHYKVNMRDKR